MLNRDDQILFNGIIFYVGYMALPLAKNLPLWRTNGVIITALLHAGPVEFLYYWFHRALHHHFLYSRYHSHHHSSIVTEPITCTKLLFKLKLISLFFFCLSCMSELIIYINFFFFFSIDFLSRDSSIC